MELTVKNTEMHPTVTRADDDFLLVIFIADGVLWNPGGDEMGFELGAFLHL